VYGFDMSPIRKLAMLEPLVDVVDPDQLVSGDTELIRFDLHKVTKADLDFTADFEIVFDRNDHCHALVMHFDTIFSACHKPLTLTTSARNQPTHWKQTVFYLDDEIRVFAGERMTGTLSLKANAENPRDLDVTIHYKFEGRSGKYDRVQEFRMR